MTRYYFDLPNGYDLIRDDEGVDADSPDKAIEEARAALVVTPRNEEAPGLGDGWHLIIRDKSGTTPGTISFDSGTFHEPDTAVNTSAP